MTIEPVVELATGLRRTRGGPAIGPVPCGPYRYGAHFVDRTTGLRFEAHHPVLRPDRWAAYLDGAIREYARFGLADLVDRETLTAADDVLLFFVGFDAEDRVVAGVRCHGPLDDVDGSQALVEMASSSEADGLRETVRATVPHGVVEIKGAWREGNRDEAHLVATTLGRCAVHALHWVGAEVALGAVAERLKPTSRISGAEMIGTESAAYPSEEYRTILMGWHRATGRPAARPDQLVLLREEGEQLLAGPAPGARRELAPDQSSTPGDGPTASSSSTCGPIPASRCSTPSGANARSCVVCCRRRTPACSTSRRATSTTRGARPSSACPGRTCSRCSDSTATATRSPPRSRPGCAACGSASSG